MARCVRSEFIANTLNIPIVIYFHQFLSVKHVIHMFIVIPYNSSIKFSNQFFEIHLGYLNWWLVSNSKPTNQLPSWNSHYSLYWNETVVHWNGQFGIGHVLMMIKWHVWCRQILFVLSQNLIRSKCLTPFYSIGIEFFLSCCLYVDICIFLLVTYVFFCVFGSFIYFNKSTFFVISISHPTN